MTGKEFRARLSRRARQAGLRITPELAARMEKYFVLLSRWNLKINLTSLTEPEEAIDRLLIEPLIAARNLPETALKLVDLGSGGGSPAIPIKLARPNIELTMVESKTRKSAFLCEAIRQLELSRSSVEQCRFEELLVRPDMHEVFDVLTARAVRVDRRRLVSFQAFLRSGGWIYLFRGPSQPALELDAVPPLRWRGTIPLLDSQHRSHLSLLQKDLYPVGVPRGTAAGRASKTA